MFNIKGEENFMNKMTSPVLAGDYADPSILRVGEDYYMTNSSFMYAPGLLVWHSKDLINWKPVCNAVKDYIGDIWAPDFICHKGMYYIYFPCDHWTYVVTAPTPEGPWSEPINMNIKGLIDPGHIVDQETGKRYLMFSQGYLIELTDDGLSPVGERVKVYDGWEYPDEWEVEGFCLESPKLFYKNGYYYLMVAEGGTAGPATSHMVAAARSKSLMGPWEHSPYNPIVHTYSAKEKWWSKGHGTLVDTPDGNWFIYYHGYEKGYHTLGRQTLVDKVEWTEDGWFKIVEGAIEDGVMPSYGSFELSESFKSQNVGLYSSFFNAHEQERYTFEGECLTLKAKGENAGESNPLLIKPAHHSYEVIVEVDADSECEAGLTLFYSPKWFGCVSKKGSKIFKTGNGVKASVDLKDPSKSVFVKIRNIEHTVSFFYSSDRRIWKKLSPSVETSSINHNSLGGFLSLRVGLYAVGSGKATFKNFCYKELD